jgi:hypothetical protein
MTQKLTKRVTDMGGNLVTVHTPKPAKGATDDWAELVADLRGSVKQRTIRWGRFVVEYINADENFRARHQISKPSQQRIEQLLALMIQLVQVLEMPDSVKQGWGRDQSTSLPRLVKDLNRRFAKYRTLPRIAVNSRLDSILMSQRMMSGKEGFAAHNIFKLAAEGLIQNFRYCICEKLFYATRVDQTSCSKTCRHKKYEQTEEFKRRRRDKARETYWLHKQGKVRERNV